ncbi:MAG: ACP S-malonyltransferase [Phycisphaeraceae bacterium]|nr:ACP S-malonyltransferase [Phycisphaeraceae bacterium]MCB9847327.1 ACP S-malonyltransferase [Phycisphaeraceae bacterium]
MTANQVILLCPGQGAQRIGMGKAWFDHAAAAAQTFGAADEILGDRLGARLSELCFHGPADVLNRTDVAQPAIYTVSVACYQALVAEAQNAGREIDILATAGLSLGEYTALHLAGSIAFADGLELVTLRGKAMQEAAEAVDSSMVALIGADEEQANRVCESAASDDILVPANFNAPGQIVLSGHTAACERAETEASKLGLRATRLEVAGAFHSPLMAPAAERLAEALSRTEIRPPRSIVCSNVTGAGHGQDEDSGATVEEMIRRRLVEQLTRPVRWADNCLWLAGQAGGADWHEMAPGKTLMGLMRRIDRGVKVVQHDEPGE